MTTKICSRCKETKAVADFSPSRQSRDGYIRLEQVYKMCYNYTSSNRIKVPGGVCETSLAWPRKDKFLMHPNDNTRPTFITLGPIAKNLTGHRFGRLVALGPVSRDARGKPRWLMQCDCGNTHLAIADNLGSGHTRSCGCLARELTSLREATHGMSNTPLYDRWRRIIQRCTNPNALSFSNYGARGITLCDAWLHNFQAFHDYVSQLPHYGEEGYSLDRIDNLLGYSPGNVRWATASEQARNRRSNRMITFNGKTQCVATWAEELHLDSDLLLNRLRKGWTVARAFTTPARDNNGSRAS